MNVSGLLLAGGKSTRFGFSKLKIRVGPLPLAADQILKLSFFCTEVIVSTSEGEHSRVSGELSRVGRFFRQMEAGEFPEEFPLLPDIRVIEDKRVSMPGGNKSTGRGPIAGIYSGLKEISGDYALVLAADMPLVSYRLMEMLVSEAGEGLKDAYIIRTKKGYEVLCGLYSKRCLGVLKDSISRGRYKVSDCFSRLDIKLIGEEALSRYGVDSLNFLNINTRQDFQRFKGIWETYRPEEGDMSGFRKRWAYFFFR
ncbi:MAG: molybdenum cofactor guanylyltransferase [Actinomycetota bacterium]